MEQVQLLGAWGSGPEGLQPIPDTELVAFQKRHTGRAIPECLSNGTSVPATTFYVVSFAARRFSRQDLITCTQRLHGSSF